MPRLRTPQKKAGRVMKPKSRKSSKSSKSRKSSKASKARKSSKTSSSDDAGILGYCMKCQAKKPFATSKIVIMKNGRKAKKGKCGDPNCDTTMFRIL
jgi:hypothetical protein